jgi:hypothetical protein
VAFGLCLCPASLNTALGSKQKMPVIVTPDILVNQLKRDSLRIAESFDTLCDADVREMSQLLAESSAIIFSGLQDNGRKNKELQIWSCEILINVVNSLSGAVFALRGGYRLIPGVILRNAIEAMAVCLHGLQKPETLERLRTGNFDSPKAINTAKQVIPPFGEMYGFLSNTFAHMGPLHHSIQPLVPYQGREDDLVVNLRAIRAALWLLYVVTEFAFIDLIQNPRYWRFDPPHKIVYDPPETEKQWQKEFLHGPDAA